MNDMTLVAVGSIVFVCACLAFVGFHIYSGLQDSLVNAKVGKVYNFIYQQPLNGEPERYMARVLEVYQLSEDSIRRLNRKSHYRSNDPTFERTAHLVTAQTPDGKIRNFYAERTINVRRPLLGEMMFKTGLASLLF